MSILRQLSSQTGDRTELSNRRVVAHCLDNPDLIVDVAAGLKVTNLALVADCVEVLTHIADYHPGWVVPYAADIALLLTSENTRLRWEAMHALALISSQVPAIMAELMPSMQEILRTEKSVIVRDHATDALAGYASTREEAAEAAFPILKEMLSLWNGKQAGHALLGMVQVGRFLPSLRPELRQLGISFLQFPRPVIRKAARVLLKSLDSYR